MKPNHRTALAVGLLVSLLSKATFGQSWAEGLLTLKGEMEMALQNHQQLKISEANIALKKDQAAVTTATFCGHGNLPRSSVPDFPNWKGV